MISMQERRLKLAMAVQAIVAMSTQAGKAMGVGMPIPVALAAGILPREGFPSTDGAPLTEEDVLDYWWNKAEGQHGIMAEIEDDHPAKRMIMRTADHLLDTLFDDDDAIAGLIRSSQQMEAEDV